MNDYVMLLIIIFLGYIGFEIGMILASKAEGRKE